MTTTDRGTVVEVSTIVLGDELVGGVAEAHNLITHPTLVVASGAITGWQGTNVTITGTSGAPTVVPTDANLYAWLASPTWPVVAGETYTAAVSVGNQPQTVAMVFSDGHDVETTSSGRVQVAGVAAASGTAWLELRWPPVAVTAGYGAGPYNAGNYGG